MIAYAGAGIDEKSIAKTISPTMHSRNIFLLNKLFVIIFFNLYKKPDHFLVRASGASKIKLYFMYYYSYFLINKTRDLSDAGFQSLNLLIYIIIILLLISSVNTLPVDNSPI